MIELIEKIRKNEKGICITIVLTGKIVSFDDKEKAQIHLRKSVASVKKTLRNEYGEEVAKKLEKRLNNVFYNLDLGKARQTLVVYATENFDKALWLPFPEKARIIVRNSFDLQPLYNAMNRESDYWVLALSKNKTRLFRARNENLTEIIDENFPAAYQEQFQYEKQRYALSYKAGTYSMRDAKVETERFHAFFRHIDHLLKPYIKKENLPFVLLGVKNNLAEFIHRSSFAKTVAAEIHGNFDYFTSGQIAKKVWLIAKENILPQALLK